MLGFQHAHGLIGRIVLAVGQQRAVVFRLAVIDGTLDGQSVVRRAGVVDIVVDVVRGGVERHKHRVRRVPCNAQAGILISALVELRLGALPVVDDVHAADLTRIVDVQIVMSARALGRGEILDVEVRGSGGVGRVRRSGDDFERRVRALALARAADLVARHGIPAGGVDVLRGEIIQFPRSADGRPGSGLRRAGEVDPAVGIGLQRVIVSPDGTVLRLGIHVVVELRDVVVDADAVEHDLAEVPVGHFAVVVLVQPLLIPGVFVGRFRLVDAHAVDLIVVVRAGGIAVRLVRHVHRVVDVGIGLVRAVDGIGRDAAGEVDARAGFRVVGGQRVVHFIDDIHCIVRLHKAVERGVVRNTEIVAHIGAVERDALEIEVGIVHRARRIADVVGRCVIDAVAVDVDTRRIVRRDHQRGNDRLDIVDARLDVGHLCPHERTLYGRAVRVVRGVRLHAVDEVDIVPLLHDEPALGDDLGICRGIVRKRGELIAAGSHRRSRDRQRRRSGEYTEFFE